MNAFRVAGLLLVSVVATSFANETNTPAPASAASNALPNGVTSNALPDTITIDGVIYSNVTWGTVTPTTVTIFHETGVATIPLARLPPDLRKQFGYDPAKAKAYDEAYAAQIEQGRAAAMREERANRAGLFYVRVVQVVPDGLLVMTKTVGVYSYPDPPDWKGPVLLINVPNFGSYTEDKVFPALFDNVGVYRYVDTSGATRQVDKMEYLGSWSVKQK